METLPRLQSDIVLINEDKTPSLPFQIFWDKIANSLEFAINKFTDVLVSLSELDTSTGLVEQTGPAAFDKRSIGIDTDNSIPTYGDINTYFVPSFRVWREFYLTNS